MGKGRFELPPLTWAILLTTTRGTVEKALFSITCTTCRARLAVRNESAIGAILECPKCTSMVQVVPPVGWKSPSATLPADPQPTAVQQRPAIQQPPALPLGHHVEVVPKAPNSPRTAWSGSPAAESAGTVAVPGGCESPSGPWASPTELLWRKWLLLGTVSVAGVVLVFGLWSMLFSSDEAEPDATSEVQQPAEPVPESPPEQPAEEPQPLPFAAVEPPAMPPADPEPGTFSEQEPSPAVDPPGENTIADAPEPTPVVEPDPATEEDHEPPTVAINSEPKLPQLDFGLPEPEPESKEPYSEPKEPVVFPETSPSAIIERPAVPAVDAEARLAGKIPEIALREMPLAEAVDLLAELSGVPITFDPEALSRLGVTVRDPITVEFSEATIGEVLQQVVGNRGLAAVVEDGQVLVTVQPDGRETLKERPYTVSDLTGSDPAAVAEMASLVEKLVEPDSWRRGGGRGTIAPDGGALRVVQTDAVHYQILVFCEKLRTARGKPLRSRLDPNRFTLSTHRSQAAKLLSLPITVNFHEPAPLAYIVSYLEELTGADILIDRRSLRAAGWSAQAEATLTSQEQPLAATLDALLGPIGLAYRAIDARTLQITTQAALIARQELEFYPITPLLGGGRTGPDLAAEIKARLAGPTWSDSGGPGELHFDEPSGCLIVLQSQPVQAAVERFLSQKAQ